jgi:hypothetical protein
VESRLIRDSASEKPSRKTSRIDTQNQATHAQYAANARAFFLRDFVSIENKGSKIQLPSFGLTKGGQKVGVYGLNSST